MVANVNRTIEIYGTDQYQWWVYRTIEIYGTDQYQCRRLVHGDPMLTEPLECMVPISTSGGG